MTTAEAVFAQGVKTEITATLCLLREAANAVLVVAEEVRPEGHGDAVNWADLSCVQARLSVDHDGEVWFEIEVEEVAPGNVALARFVSRRLAERGWPDVQVVTNW